MVYFFNTSNQFIYLILATKISTQEHFYDNFHRWIGISYCTIYSSLFFLLKPFFIVIWMCYFAHAYLTLLSVANWFCAIFYKTFFNICIRTGSGAVWLNCCRCKPLTWKEIHLKCMNTFTPAWIWLVKVNWAWIWIPLWIYASKHILTI